MPEGNPPGAAIAGAATRALERLDVVERRLGEMEARLVALEDRRTDDRRESGGVDDRRASGDDRVSEREAILHALARTQGNVSRAAVALGVSRRLLQARMREHGLPEGRRGRPRQQVGARDAGTR